MSIRKTANSDLLSRPSDELRKSIIKLITSFAPEVQTEIIAEIQGKGAKVNYRQLVDTPEARAAAVREFGFTGLFDE